MADFNWNTISRFINKPRIRLISAALGITPEKFIINAINKVADNSDHLGLKEGLYATSIGQVNDVHKADVLDIILSNMPKNPEKACRQIIGLIDGVSLLDNGIVVKNDAKIGQIIFNNRSFDNVINQLVKILTGATIWEVR